MNRPLGQLVAITLLLLQINDSLATQKTQSTIPVTFRQRGFIAEALSWAHLKTTVNVSHLEVTLKQAEIAINESIENADWNRANKNQARMKVYASTVLETLKTPARLLDLIDLTFFSEKPDFEVPPHISFHRPIGLNDNRDHPMKQKRQLLEVAASLSLGMSIYNFMEIRNLQSRVDNLETENQHIISVLEDDHLMINALNQAVKTLNSSMITYADELTRISDQVQLLSVHTLIHAKVEDLSQEFSLMFNGLVQLGHGTLSPNLIDKSKITTAYRNLEIKAKAKNYNLLHPEVSSIFKYDISFLADPRTRLIDIWIHVPLFKSSKLNLYEHIKTPVLFNNSADAPLIFINSPNGEFLAIDETSSKKGMELSAAFLATCNVEKTSLGSTFLCHDGISILSNDITTSCLGTLFSGSYDEKTLTDLCDVKIRDMPEYWSQVDSNLFMLYSKEPTKLTKICPTTIPGKTQSNISMIQHLQLLPLEPGCMAYTQLYSLYGKTEINIEQNFIYLPQTITFQQQIFNPVNLAKIYNELSQLNLPSEIHFSELQQWERTNSWRRHSLSIGGVLTMMAILIGLGLAGYLIWTYWKFRRPSTTAPPPRPEQIELVDQRQPTAAN